MLDYAAPATVLAARINGLFPWPACSVEIDGQPVKFGLAEATSVTTTATPGTVVVAGPTTLQIATGAGLLVVHRLQRPGGRMLPASEFLRGFPIEQGRVLPSYALPILVDTKPFPVVRKG